MDQKNIDVEAIARSLPFDLFSPEVARKRIDGLAAAQIELFDRLQDAYRKWLNRMQSEAKLACELGAKLASARSLPETASAYQEWTSQHMAMVAEDTQQLLSEGQKLIATGARLLSEGGPSNGSGARR